MHNPTIGYITLGVIDYQRSIAFFRDVIGFPLLFSDEKFQFARFQAGDVTFAVVGHGYMALFADPDGNIFYLDSVEANR
jgi:predicted enzyme related to lactoylglutathione lyase